MMTEIRKTLVTYKCDMCGVGCQSKDHMYETERYVFGYALTDPVYVDVCIYPRVPMGKNNHVCKTCAIKSLRAIADALEDE